MPLLVYKSSAGSGKTTTLVNEYLKITLKNPYSFSHVLAITFTNNAANEMKERILLALEKLISKEAWGDGELKHLIKSLGFEQEVLIQKAKTLQQLILHRYDDFAVSTIDSFVHRIIRTFTRDVQLPQNFEVVIEQDDIVPDIVDELFSKVGHDKALTKIMVKFVMSQIDDEKNYDLGRLITEFVSKQFGEDGFSFLNKISDLSPEDFVQIIEKIHREILTLRKEIKNKASEALALIHKNGLGIDDFKSKGSGIYGYFNKVSKFDSDKSLEVNKTAEAAIYEDAWTTKTTSEAVKASIDQIKAELTEKFDNIQQKAKRYLFLSAIYNKIYALALTNQIRNILNDYTDRTQKVHISEFNKKISNEISDQPVPFIYERLGTKFQYFLIDEFQDTSVLQWQNLLPLVEESLSNNNFNLLVGDAKQAIYRFRSGEVELFVKLPKLYGKPNSPSAKATENLLGESYREVQLADNWRSMSEIVKFNNEFFGVSKSNFGERLSKIYEKHEQNIPASEKKQGGFVSIKLIDTKKTEDFNSLRLIEIVKNVNQLLDVGYRQGDICVLTRTNSAAVDIATHLIENGFNVITSESLLLTNSAKVRLCVAFLRLLNQPTFSGLLAEFIQNLGAVNNNNDFHQLFELADEGKASSLKAVFNALDLKVNIGKMMVLPVFEIVESFIFQLNLFKSPDTYLRFFLDFVLVTQENGRGSIDTFLELWDQKKEKLYITMPDGGDALKIMTVHKAKGLKFEAVILDVADRRVKKGKQEYWTDITVKGLEELKVGLFAVTKSLEKIGFKEVYEEEEEKTKLDFINMVYVAFTRAVSALFVIGHTGGSRKEKFSTYLLDYLKIKDTWREESEDAFEIGMLSQPVRKTKSTEKEVLVLEKVISSSWEKHIRIAPADEVYWEAIDSKPARVYGNLIHAMLSKIVVSEDVDNVVNTYSLSSVIDEQEAKELKSILNGVVSHPLLNPLFSNDVVVKNETEILDPFSKPAIFQRPDRVVLKDDILFVIDYKTGEKDKKHHSQIQGYGRIFQQMGFSKIELMLVYVRPKVEVVDVPMATNKQHQLF